MKSLAKRELRHLLAEYHDEIGKEANEDLVDEIATRMAQEGANLPRIDQLKAEIYEAIIAYKTEHDLY